MSVEALQEYIFTTKYARFRPEIGRRETYEEAVDRVMDMHAFKYRGLRVKEEIEFCREVMKERLVVGSQRALQFGGDPILKKEARLYNCLGQETEFITNKGVQSFKDFRDGDWTVVLGSSGEWRRAKVRNYGKQQLYKVTICRGGSDADKFSKHIVRATKDHRWILKHGDVTTDLKVGDRLMFGPDIFEQFDYDAAPPDERLYWAYGYVYGDGTRVKYANKKTKESVYGYSMVRLCGKDAVRFKYRYEELGFDTSSNLSINGDVIAFTGRYLKTLPNPSIDPPRLIRAFVRGYLDADGAKNRHASGKYGAASPFCSIQATGQESIEFIRSTFPTAGVYLVSESDKTHEVTNFGPRTDTTISFRVASSFGKTAGSFRVTNIEEDKFEDVWCLEVEHDNAFVLPNGVVTGNCSAMYCDRPRFFQEALWMLLCGTGLGFSVQKHHVAKLPKLIKTNCVRKVFVIADTIEGWADSLGVLLASYGIAAPEFKGYVGTNVDFDFSEIRPKGSALSSGSGKAPGPDPLRKALEKIHELLARCVEAGQERLRPIDSYDIVMHASDAVLSGGVRRSASLSLFSPDDEEMMNAKIGDWFVTNPQRGRSNNSALLLRNSTSREVFDRLMKSTKECGEPGFVWADSTEIVYNPCQPGWATVLTPEGIRTFDDIKIGSTIWSGKRWTKVTDKVFTGIKPVYGYHTRAGIFYGTENHRVISGGERVEAKDAESIDVVVGALQSSENINVQDVMDGMVLGDGSVHRASNNLVLLNVGEQDMCLLHSELKPYFIDHRPGIGPKVWEINTTIAAHELTKTYDRKVPDRFLHGSTSTMRGFLRGLYTANGSVVGSRVTLKASSFAVIEDAQQMLSALGIRSYYTVNKAHTVKFDNGEYECKESYDLNIGDLTARKLFRATVGFVHDYKMERLNAICEEGCFKTPKSSFEIVDREFIAEERVYDITVEDEEHTYWTGGLLVSNCSEIGLYPTIDGESGVAFCNLSEINVKACKTEVIFKRAARAAAILGTLQAGYTKFEYLGEVSERIAKREALLGVSMTGMMDNPEIAFNPEIQQRMAKYILEINAEVAVKIGVNPTARATCTKPSGCRPLSSTVVTDRGILTLEELLENHAIDEDWGEVKGNIAACGTGKITRTFRNGYAQIAEIVLQNGRKLYSTLNHPWGVSENGEVKFIRTDALEIGDKLFYKLGLYNNVTESHFTAVSAPEHFNCKEGVTLPEKMTPNLAYLLGLLTGNGSFSDQKYRIRFCHKSEEIINHYADLFAEIFGARPPVHRASSDRDMWTADIASKFLYDWFTVNGLKKPKSHLLVNVFRKVREASKESVLAFIAGYADSDGCFYQNLFCIDSASETMMRNIQVIGEAVGICFGISHNVGGTNLQKNKSMWKCAAQKMSSNADAFEGINRHSIKAKQSPLRKSERQLKTTSPYTVVAVKRLDEPVETADVEVADTHSFYEGAILSHNTTSCILGTSSGIHAQHSKRYFRRAQGNELEAPMHYFQKINPRAVEPSVWSANGTDKVVTFCLEASEKALTKAHVSAVKQLEYVKLTVQNWVAAGRNPERCAAPFLHHNVSNTVVVEPDEWDKVANFIYENRNFLSGVSLLPESGDRDYPQAPFCQVFTPAEIVEMYGDGALMASGLIVDGMHAFKDNLWAACDCALGIGEKLEIPTYTSTSLAEYRVKHDEIMAKLDWVRRAYKFAKNYFGGDMKKMTFALKDTSNYKLWCDLRRDFKPVDWSKFVEERDQTTAVEADLACAGGACSVSYANA